MKKFRSVVSALMVSALVFSIPAASYAKGKTHDEKAEVVSIDETANTITIKNAKGENHTAPLMGDAIAQAKSFKPGDKVMVTCQDKESGEHEGVTAIKKGS